MGGFGGYGPGFGMMGGWGGGGFFPFHWIFGLLFLVLVVVAMVLFARALTRSRERLPETGRHPAGLDLLDQRYARGEINRDEYLQKRADVLG